MAQKRRGQSVQRKSSVTSYARRSHDEKTSHCAEDEYFTREEAERQRAYLLDKQYEATAAEKVSTSGPRKVVDALPRGMIRSSRACDARTLD